MAERITTLLSHQRTINDFQRVQADLAKLQKQITSGSLAESFDELKDNLNRSVSLETLINQSDTYSRQNGFVITRLRTMAYRYPNFRIRQKI